MTRTSKASGLDYVLVELGRKDSIYPDLSIPVLEKHLGDAPDIEDENIRIRVGTRPIVRDLGALYQGTGRPVPAEMQDLFTGYRVLLLNHSMSVLREQGRKNISSIGFEVSFPESPRITIIDLFPRTTFVQNVGATLDSSFVAEAGIGVNGRLSTPPLVTELLSQIDDMSMDAKLNCKLQLSNKAGFVAKFSYAVLSPLVQAIGVGDTHGQWIIDKKSRPLLGDLIFSQTILAPKNSSGIKFKVRASATITTYSLMPDKKPSRWINAEYFAP